MGVFYWAGYVLGFAGALAAMLSPVLLFATRRGRLLWLPALLRRVVTGRWRARRPDHARIAELERELG